MFIAIAITSGAVIVATLVARYRLISRRERREAGIR